MPLKIHCDSQVQIDPGELEKIEEEREREREREDNHNNIDKSTRTMYIKLSRGST